MKELYTLSEVVLKFLKTCCINRRNIVHLSELENYVYTYVKDGKVTVFSKCFDVVRSRLYMLISKYVSQGLIKVNDVEICINCEKVWTISNSEWHE